MSVSLKKHFTDVSSVFEMKKFLLLNRIKQKMNPEEANKPENLKKVAIIKQQVAFEQKKSLQKKVGK